MLQNRTKLIEFGVLLVASILLGKGLIGGIILGLIYGVGKYVYTKFVSKDIISPSILQPIGLGALAGLISFILRLIL